MTSLKQEASKSTQGICSCGASTKTKSDTSITIGNAFNLFRKIDYQEIQGNPRSSIQEDSRSDNQAPATRPRQLSLPDFRSTHWRKGSVASIISRISVAVSIRTTKKHPDEFWKVQEYENEKISLQEFLYTGDLRRASATAVLPSKSTTCVSPGVTEKRPSSISFIPRRLCKFGSRRNEEPVWTDRFDLHLSKDVSRDLSELEYLRRRNKLAADGILGMDEDEDEEDEIQASLRLHFQPTYQVGRSIMEPALTTLGQR